MKRRSFLVGASALTLGSLTSGCNNRQPGAASSLKVRLLQDSIPAQLLSEFQQVLPSAVALDFEPEEQLQDLFARLQLWKQQAKEQEPQPSLPLPFVGQQTPVTADLVTLGDYWLQDAIAQQLIQPLALGTLAGWQQLPPQWQEIVKRNSQGQLDASGAIWGAPYRWGTTVIAYRQDRFRDFGWTPTDWSDLWRPELQGRISLLDQPREVIGLTLKKLGRSYNTTDLAQVLDLKAQLQALHQQAKFYSSDHYLQPLILGDTAVAVAWSTDIVPLMQSDRQIKAVIPLAGTALWADLWVQPVSATAPARSSATGKELSLVQQWIDFCWQTEPASEISLFSDAASPILTGIKRETLPKTLQNNTLLLPTPPILEKSEFLKPLPPSTLEQYQALWKEIRLSTPAS